MGNFTREWFQIWQSKIYDPFFSNFLGLKTKDGNKIITTGLESNIDSHLTKQKYLENQATLKRCKSH